MDLYSRLRRTFLLREAKEHTQETALLLASAIDTVWTVNPDSSKYESNRDKFTEDYRNQYKLFVHIRKEMEKLLVLTEKA